jgi:hypothetical protein
MQVANIWVGMDKIPYITNLQVSWVHSKCVQNLLFDSFVLFKHECCALFKHKSHVYYFCV